MEKKTEILFILMKVFAYIAFIGLSIEAGSILVSLIVSLVVSGQAAQNLYLGLNLGKLHELSLGSYVVLGALIFAIYVLKALLAYFLIRILDTLKPDNPFQEKVVHLISKLGNTALTAGFVGVFVNLLVTQVLNIAYRIQLPVKFDVSEFFFLAGIIFILSKIFKRGVEIQTENELTV
ncbi:MAG: DUF2975 domain-containing protein [Cyclobacteriaceae bacterium]|nr:DUF2975 domain-containing protein [Cyclobacteriaceae bacterium]MDX5465740.1 DUF2975 domain-containing protein [Cyclobacteriaceae bacterium]